MTESTRRPRRAGRRGRRGRGRPPARPGDHHRHVRRRAEHGRQRAGGPGLVRGRQPAAGPAAHARRAGRAVAGRRRPDGRRGRRPQPGLLRRPDGCARAARRRRQRPADHLPGGVRRRPWSAGTRPSGARTRCRATVGWSTASPASARCCATCAPRRTSSSTPPTSTSTSCGAKVLAAFDGRTSRACTRRSCRSASSTACRSTPTWWSTAGSCRTRTGCPSCGR